MLLNQTETLKLLRKYSFSFPSTYIIESEKELKATKSPVVLKVDSPDVIHKSDLGVVYVNLENKTQIAEKIKEAKLKLKKKKISNFKFIVQEMVNGQELIVGMKRDPVFGPVILFGRLYHISEFDFSFELPAIDHLN